MISRRALRECWSKPGCRDAEQPLKAWFREVEHAEWASPADIKAAFASASIVSRTRVVFNIGGNKYRLVAAVHCGARIVYVRFVGTHREYDGIDVKVV